MPVGARLPPVGDLPRFGEPISELFIDSSSSKSELPSPKSFRFAVPAAKNYFEEAVAPRVVIGAMCAFLEKAWARACFC